MSSDGLRAEARDALTVRLSLLHFLHRTDRACSRHGMTPQLYQLLLLVAAADREALEIAELPGLLEIGQPAASELVGRAVRAGLVERRRHPERAADDGFETASSCSRSPRRRSSACSASRSRRSSSLRTSQAGTATTRRRRARSRRSRSSRAGSRQ